MVHYVSDIYRKLYLSILESNLPLCLGAKYFNFSLKCFLLFRTSHDSSYGAEYIGYSYFWVFFWSLWKEENNLGRDFHFDDYFRFCPIHEKHLVIRPPLLPNRSLVCNPIELTPHLWLHLERIHSHFHCCLSIDETIGCHYCSLSCSQVVTWIRLILWIWVHCPPQFDISSFWILCTRR